MVTVDRVPMVEAPTPAHVKKLDNFKATLNGRTVGPLRGLPACLSVQRTSFTLKDVDITMGYVGRTGGNLGTSDPSQTHRVESQITNEMLSLGRGPSYAVSY